VINVYLPVKARFSGKNVVKADSLDGSARRSVGDDRWEGRREGALQVSGKRQAAGGPRHHPR
jgi:hypothetical protein